MGETRFSLNLVLGLVFLISTPLSQASDHVPVLIWGGDSVSGNHIDHNSFRITPQKEFHENLKQKVGSKPVLLFVKKDFCVEYITQDVREEWKNVNSLQYYSAVESPVTTFKEMFKGDKTVSKVTEVDQIPPEHLKIVEIENLNEIFDILKKTSPNSIIALSGDSCIYTKSDRSKRQAPSGNSTKEKFIYKSRMLLTADEAPILKIDNSTHKLDNWKEKEVKEINSAIIFTIVLSGEKYTGTFDFSFQVLTSRYYTLKTISFSKENGTSVKLEANMDINFPFDFSYHCTPKVVFKAGDYSISFDDIQIQIDSKDGDFSDAYDCVGFMSIPIWSGIFVTSILALIMIWGIIFIMDIRSMDRFDDPKGKTITISASE